MGYFGKILKQNWQIPLLLIIYSVMRHGILATLGSPIFGWLADLASIALNYYRNGFHFFYPQVLWGGSGPGYVEMEFPALPYLTALLYKLFGVHEYLDLVIPFITGFGLVWVTYRLGTYLFDGMVGFAAGAITATAPTLVMLTSYGLFPDHPMVFFGTLGLYFLVLWVDSDRWGFLALGAMCVSMAILLKAVALYLGIPVLYLFIRREGPAWWRGPLLWITGFAILIPPILWYWHAYHLYTEYGNTFGILSAGYSKFGTSQLLTDPYFYLRTARRVVSYHLSPLASITCVYGFFLAFRNKKDIILHVWLGSVLLYVLVAARGVWDGHYQYMIPILPPLAILAAAGMIALARHFGATSFLQNHRPLRRAAAPLFALLFALNVIWAVRLFETRDRFYEARDWEKKKHTGQVVKTMTVPGSLLIVVDTQMDGETPETSMTPPDVFYFSDRRGWYLSMAWLSEKLIEQLRKKGAQYFVVSGQSVFDFKKRLPRLVEYLSSRYKTVLDSSDGIVYDLKAR